VSDSGVTWQELELWLWGAADIRWGPVKPRNFQDFIYPLILLKWLSDTWETEDADAIEALGDWFADEIARVFQKLDEV
jgi:type I restriction-modification system DNA methylase subunit